MARLIKKSTERPKWNPPNHADISDNDIEEFYFNSETQFQLNLLKPRSFQRYPFTQFGLPSEEEIEKVVTGENRNVGSLAMTREEVVDFFLKDRRGKIGVREKVISMLDRKTGNMNDGTDSLRWIH